MLSLEHIKKCAAEVGFTLCGVARARVLTEQADLYGRALAASGDAALGYLARDPARRLDPARFVEGARTVAVCAVNYRNERSGGYPAGLDAPKMASYALSGTYQPKILGMLSAMAARLGLGGECGAGGGAKFGRGAGGGKDGARWRALCDTSAILEKAWAVEAGLGWVGRNSLLVTPRHGSFLLLGELVTTEDCDGYDAPYSGMGCGACRRCVERCPAGALVPQRPRSPQGAARPGGDGAGECSAGGAVSGVGRSGGGVSGLGACASVSGGLGVCALDTGRCVSALTIEKTPEPVDPARLHGWIFGCDECQSVCPYNRLSPPFDNPLFAPRFDPADFSAAEWCAMTPARFAETFADTPLERAGMERMQKNVGKAKKEG